MVRCCRRGFAPFACHACVNRSHSTTLCPPCLPLSFNHSKPPTPPHTKRCPQTTDAKQQTPACLSPNNRRRVYLQTFVWLAKDESSPNEYHTAVYLCLYFGLFSGPLHDTSPLYRCLLLLLSCASASLLSLLSCASASFLSLLSCASASLLPRRTRYV